MFYGGHHPLKGKGLHAVFKAMALLKTRLGPKAPKLKVHGYFSSEDLTAVKDLAAQSGLENDIAWLNQIPDAGSLPPVPVFAVVRASLYGKFCGTCRGHRGCRGIARDRHEERRNPRAHRRKRNLDRQR